MAATIGQVDLQKNVARAAASGYVVVKGIRAESVKALPKMSALDKDAAPSFALVTDGRGEKRARKVAGDKATAERTAAAVAMKQSTATVYLAQLAGKSEVGDVYKLLSSYRRR